jgi:2',3'-cyclic-nucleotide 2'-phosphodiesterase/3'-nucleotidase
VDTPKNENASQLVVKQVPGFDIVFVGHDHQGWDTSFVNTKGEEVLLLGASSSARDVSVADILMTFDEKTNRWNKELLGEIINMKDYKPDEDFMKKFADGLEEVKNYVSKPIGEFTESISTRESLFGNSSFVDLIHSIQLDLTKADISFTAPLSFNTEINSGQVYVGDMFELYHYENLLYTMDLTGQEILDYLEYSYALWFNEMKSEDDNLLNFERDKKGNLVYSERYNAPELKARYYNFDSAAGIDYIVDVSKPVGKRVKIISLSNGEPFELRKIYKTAINSYRGNGGGGHLIDGAKIPKDKLTGRIVNSTEKDLRYYLMKWIEKNKIVTPKAFGNWKVVPDKWWAKGKEKDYILLYKK